MIRFLNLVSYKIFFLLPLPQLAQYAGVEDYTAAPRQTDQNPLGVS